jgi:siroheme synthase
VEVVAELVVVVLVDQEDLGVVKVDKILAEHQVMVILLQLVLLKVIQEETLIHQLKPTKVLVVVEHLQQDQEMVLQLVKLEMVELVVL